MKKVMVTVMAAVVCLTVSAGRTTVIPAMGSAEQTVVKMLGTPAEVLSDGNEVVYHNISYKDPLGSCRHHLSNRRATWKVMKSVTLTEPCRNAQEAFDLNAGLQQQLRRGYGCGSTTTPSEGWMTCQGGEAFRKLGTRYAFTMSTQKRRQYRRCQPCLVLISIYVVEEDSAIGP